MASKSDGTDHIVFKIHVEDENVQRMIIGKKGRNANWMRDRFKVSYAKLYKRSV